MDTSFLNVGRGSRLSIYMGLVMAEGHAFKYGPDYTYVEIPLMGYCQEDGDLKDKVLRNQYVKAVPACSLHVKGNYKVQVEPNPVLAAYGMIQPGYYVHPGQTVTVPSFYFHARRDTALADVSYAVRLYLRA